jgi:IS30 family transposase
MEAHLNGNGSRLSEEQIAEILHLHVDEGWRQVDIAKHLEVSPSTIQRVIANNNDRNRLIYANMDDCARRVTKAALGDLDSNDTTGGYELKRRHIIKHIHYLVQLRRKSLPT